MKNIEKTKGYIKMIQIRRDKKNSYIYRKMRKQIQRKELRKLNLNNAMLILQTKVFLF